MDTPPVLHDALAGLVDGAGDRHPTVFDVGVDRWGDVAVAEGDEGVTFPLLVRASLAAVGGQGDDMASQFARERAQRPTGVDGGELAVVAEKDELGSGGIDIGTELVEGAAADHRRLVEDDHVAGGQAARFPQIGQELGERRAGDARPCLEVGGRPRRHRRADHPESCLLPADPGGPEQCRLAGSGLADHQVVAVARAEQCPHTVGLFDVQMGMESKDAFDHVGGNPAGSFADPCEAELMMRCSAASSSVVV